MAELFVFQWRCQICRRCVKRQDVVLLYWSGFALLPSLLNPLIQALLIFKQFLQGFKEVGYFFNQTSKQLIFIEQPFGSEPTIGFPCWFIMLLLFLSAFYFWQDYNFFQTPFSHNFAHSRVLSICTLLKHRTELPSQSDWSSLNHKLENSWTPRPVYKRMRR